MSGHCWTAADTDKVREGGDDVRMHGVGRQLWHFPSCFAPVNAEPTGRVCVVCLPNALGYAIGVYVYADLTSFKGRWTEDRLEGILHPQSGTRSLAFGLFPSSLRCASSSVAFALMMCAHLGMGWVRR